jgi:hypothetical protein
MLVWWRSILLMKVINSESRNTVTQFWSSCVSSHGTRFSVSCRLGSLHDMTLSVIIRNFSVWCLTKMCPTQTEYCLHEIYFRSLFYFLFSWVQNLFLNERVCSSRWIIQSLHLKFVLYTLLWMSAMWKC